jgi:hypothetical protein
LHFRAVKHGAVVVSGRPVQQCPEAALNATIKYHAAGDSDVGYDDHGPVHDEQRFVAEIARIVLAVIDIVVGQSRKLAKGVVSRIKQEFFESSGLILSKSQ